MFKTRCTGVTEGENEFVLVAVCDAGVALNGACTAFAVTPSVEAWADATVPLIDMSLVPVELLELVALVETETVVAFAGAVLFTTAATTVVAFDAAALVALVAVLFELPVDADAVPLF